MFFLKYYVEHLKRGDVMISSVFSLTLYYIVFLILRTIGNRKLTHTLSCLELTHVMSEIK